MLKSGAPSQDRRARVLILAAVAGVVFGILGMHSFVTNDPGPHTESLSAMPAMDQPDQQVAAMSHDAAHAAEAPQGHDQHGGDPSGSTDLSDHCGMLALCLVALIGGALLLWGVMGAIRRRPITQFKRVTTSARSFVKSVSRPPPDLISLSILRC